MRATVCIVLLVYQATAGKCLILGAPSATMGPNSQMSTEFQLLLSLFHNETRRLEQYVAALENKVAVGEDLLQQKLNETEEHLIQLTTELQTEKSKRIQLQRDNDDLTFKFYNLSLSYNSIISKVNSLHTENTHLRDNILNLTSDFSGIDVHNLKLDHTQLLEIKQKQGYKVAFTVSKPKAGVVNGTITFQTVLSNIGNQFNAVNGKFNCTIAGVYYFSLTVVKVDTSNAAFCFIRLNGQEKIQAGSDPPPDADGGFYGATNAVIFHLRTGDVVDVGGCSAVSTMFEDTSFSGFLVKAD